MPMPEVTRRFVVVDAPSNLGLRPPEEGAVPGCYKAPGALRDTGLLNVLGAQDGGVVTPGQYRPGRVAGAVRPHRTDWLTVMMLAPPAESYCAITSFSGREVSRFQAFRTITSIRT